MAEANWSGTYTYRAERVHHPATLDELREVVAAAPRIRVLATRHAFSDIADSAELVEFGGLPKDVVVDHARGTATVSAALTYADIALALAAEGVALPNLASLPHTSVGGAIATATHGSGERNGNLATSVAGLELVTSHGDIVFARRGDPDFDGLVVGLGAIGAVTTVTLDVEPAYEMRQRVFEGLSWDALFDHFDAIEASGDSVSVFTRWGDDVEQVWLKSRGEPDPELFGARPATLERHPILGLDPVNCTPQLGVPGPWYDRLPHFRMGFTPSAGEEIQSEYFVAREDGVAAIQAIRAIGERIAPLLLVSEIRTIAADDLWMSPQYGRDTVAIHFTWKREPEAVERALVGIEDALAPFSACPHWGKVFVMDAATVAPLYARHADFAALVARHDPRGAFRNAWLDRVLG